MSYVHWEFLQVAVVTSLDPQRFVLVLAQLIEPLPMGAVHDVIFCALKMKIMIQFINDLKLVEEYYHVDVYKELRPRLVWVC
jgi:hypothetical protein